MKKKYRTTAFTRFLLFMLIALPLIYFGVTYYRGEDGAAPIREFFQQDESATTEESEEVQLRRQIEKLTEERDYWRNRAESLEAQTNQ